MALMYLLILAIMIVGTAILDHRVTHVFKQHRSRLFIVIASTLLIFLSFDCVGTYMNWFWTPRTAVLGLFAGPIPFEEVVFLMATT